MKIQAVLANHCFHYSRLHFYIQNLLYAETPSQSMDLNTFCFKIKTFWWKQCSLVIRGLGIRGTFRECNPRPHEWRGPHIGMNQIITLIGIFYFVFRYMGTGKMCFQEAADSIIRDSIKRRTRSVYFNRKRILLMDEWDDRNSCQMCINI